VTDRAIPIRMKRRAPGEPVARFRRRTAQAEANRILFPERLEPFVPDVPVPDDLNDRAADSWEPLMGIAEAAGDDWPVRARMAALSVSGESGGTDDCRKHGPTGALPAWIAPLSGGRHADP